MKPSLSLVVAAAVLAAVACNKHDSVAVPPGAETSAPPASSQVAPDSAPPAALSSALASLTPNERKWGISPTRNDKVTYQPDVIVMEHGPDAVRGMASNGLTWTIDANAPHATRSRSTRSCSRPVAWWDACSR